MAESNDVLPNIQYHNPDQLAEALRLKSNETLARRVEDIAVEIKDTSVDWRKALKEQLTGDEERDLRETLPGTGVDVLFNENLTYDEEKIRDGSIIKDNLPKLVEGAEKAGGFLKSFSEGMSKVSSLLREYKWGQAISEFFKIFFGKRDGDKEEGEKRNKNITSIDSAEEKDQYKYIAGISFLLKLENISDKFSDKSGVSLNSDINAVFLNKDFYKKSFDELVHFSDKDGIGDKLRVSGNDGNIFRAVTLLKTREKALDKILSIKDPEWRKKPIFTVLVSLNKYSSFYGNLRNINFEDIFKKSNDFITFDFEGNKGALDQMIDEEINDIKSPFHSISKVYLAKIFSLPSYSKFDKDTLLMGQTGELYENFVDNFITFRNNLPGLLGESFFVGKSGSKDKFKKFFKTYKFSPREVLEFYTITGGNLDSNSYDRVKNSMIFTKVFFMLNKDDSLQGETYLNAIKVWAEGGTNDIQIPDEVKGAISFMVNSALEKALNSTLGLASRIWGALDNVERAAGIGLLVAGGLGIAFFMRAMAFGRGFSSGATFGAIGGTVIFSKVFDYFQEKHPDFLRKERIRNSTEFQNRLINGN